MAEKEFMVNTASSSDTRKDDLNVGPMVNVNDKKNRPKFFKIDKFDKSWLDAFDIWNKIDKPNAVVLKDDTALVAIHVPKWIKRFIKQSRPRPDCSALDLQNRRLVLLFKDMHGKTFMVEDENTIEIVMVWFERLQRIFPTFTLFYSDTEKSLVCTDLNSCLTTRRQELGSSSTEYQLPEHDEQYLQGKTISCNGQNDKHQRPRENEHVVGFIYNVASAEYLSPLFQRALKQPEPEYVSVLENTKHPEYERVEARQRSFQTWPLKAEVSSDSLVNAGFYYTGEADNVRCFSCDGGFKNWEPDDDPYLEHARWFPTCQYIRMIKGHQYVEHVKQCVTNLQDSETQITAKTQPPERTINAQQETQNNENLPASEAANFATTVCGFQASDLEASIKKLQQKTGSLNVSIDSFILRSLKEENESLRREQQCKVCQKEDLSVLFLPCTHVCVCYKCAETLTVCPVCRKAIKMKILTYRS